MEIHRQDRQFKRILVTGATGFVGHHLMPLLEQAYDAEIVPVEPEGWDDVRRSLAAGEIVPVPPGTPLGACDALQTPATRPINFAILKQRCGFALAVAPAEVRAAQRLAFDTLRLADVRLDEVLQAAGNRQTSTAAVRRRDGFLFMPAR